MKHLLLIFTLFSLSNLWAADVAKEPVKKEKEKEADKVQSGIVVNDTLKKLLDIKGVMPVYEKCMKEIKDGSTTKDISVCMWDKVKAEDKLKKAVQETYAQETKKSDANGRTPANAEQSLTAKQTVVATNQETDPAIQALSKFYEAKLDAVLDPEKALSKEDQKNGAILATDHRKFIDLYKSELGKTIINAFTSYCLDTDPDTCECTQAEVDDCQAGKGCSCSKKTCTISDTPAKRENHRKKNLEDLAKIDLDSKSPASMKWQMCISSVTQSCNSPASASTDTSKTRSCLIMDYVESARKNIMYADKQTKFYDDLQKDRTPNIVSNAKDVADKKKASSDAILNITSADIETALKDPMTKSSKEFEECYKDGQIVNADACKKYLNTNLDENNAALAEMGMRYNVQQSILEDELKDDAKVKSYLKEEGYTAEQIDNMTKDKADIAKVRDEILKRYADQKEAIIEDMKKKIGDKTATNNGKIDASADLPKLAQIKKDLASRKDDLAGLMKFTNIISSYISIEDKGNKSRNTASVLAEVGTMKDDNPDKKHLQDQIGKAKITEQKDSANVNFDVNQINQVLKYQVEKDQEQKQKKGN